MKVPDIYRLMIDAIVPRPVAFVTSISAKGEPNLAPFSYFNGVASNPPSIVISVTRKPDGSKKDTLRNIEETKQFVVNTISEWMVEPAHQCSADYPYGVNEMEKTGLTPIASKIVKPPRVRESPIQMECQLYGTFEVGDGSLGCATLVIGRVVLFHVSAHAYEGGRIILERIKPISRLGGSSYGRTSEIFDIPRAKVK